MLPLPYERRSRRNKMFGTLRTLISGVNSRAEERVRAAHAIELIDQKIREAGDGLKLAKMTLASLIQRQRGEDRQIKILETRAADLTQRAREALSAGRDDLATEAAEAIAVMENELTLRRETLARLETRVMRLRSSVETASRRIIDLKQGSIAARALRDEQALQTRLNTTLSGQSSMAEAEELIAQVLRRADPYEQSEILVEIDRGLTRENVADKLAEQGFGAATKTTTADVLARLKA
jgi:phage shock protein A